MFRLLAVVAVMMLAGQAVSQTPANMSRVTMVISSRIQTEGDYVRISGEVRGVVDPREPVVDLASLPRNSAGQYEYRSNFEIIQRVPYGPGKPQTEVLYIDSENRGSAVSQGALGAFLKNHATAYARVQWQTGISAGVPENAQGVGLVIMRDFARWLGGRTPKPQTQGESTDYLDFLGPYPKLILGGISQSAWFVNTFIAEGFNVDPLTERRVFDGAIAIDGIGNWLAINNIAVARGVTKQTPYVDPNGKPLSKAELMIRPRTDPVYIDVANYTDFYRLRAGITSVKVQTRNFRRYDMPSMHVASRELSNPRCNGGVRIQQNPLAYAPYMRALVLGLEKQIGVKSAAGAHNLPDSALFRLATEQPPAGPGFNPLPGVKTLVPMTNGDAIPQGGVRFPELTLPIGKPVPPSLPPAVTTSISETCGNSGGFQPFGKAALNARYGSREIYLGKYDQALDRLIGGGYLLEEDRMAMLTNIEELYDKWP